MRAALVLAALATSASAGELRPQAQKHLDAGVAAYSKGDYPTAIQELEAAYAITPDPALLYTWAQAERRGGHCTSAIDHYRLFLQSHPSDTATAVATDGIVACARAEAMHPLPWYRDAAFGGITVGTAGIGVGIGFLVASTDSTGSHATAQQWIGASSIVLGAALVGTGIGYHVYRARRDRRAAAAAVVATDGRSLFIAGTF